MSSPSGSSSSGSSGSSAASSSAGTVEAILAHVQASWKQHGEKLLVRVDQQLQSNEYLKLFQTKTGVRPSLLVFGASLLVVMFIWYRLGGSFVAASIGFLYPLYESYRSLDDGVEDEHDTMWLTYWVVFALLHTVESVTDVLLNWIPLYYLVKIGVLVWCFLPQTRGALTLYHKVIEPLLVKYEPQIDRARAHAHRASQQFKRDVARNVAGAVLDEVARGDEAAAVTAARKRLSESTTAAAGSARSSVSENNAGGGISSSGSFSGGSGSGASSKSSSRQSSVSQAPPVAPPMTPPGEPEEGEGEPAEM